MRVAMSVGMHTSTTLSGLMLLASISACTASAEPSPVEAPRADGAVAPERYLGPTCLNTTPEATLDFANGPFATASANAAYTAPGSTGEYVVQLNGLDVAWAESYKAGTSLGFKDGSYPATSEECVNARLDATVYAYEGGGWIEEGTIAMHGTWIYSGGWSCAPAADTAGSSAVYFNPAFGFSAGRVVASAKVLAYGRTAAHAIPLGVDLY
jgi:hypothetical protein